jgi:EmrB/QacA subfamily drug resistance transporter
MDRNLTEAATSRPAMRDGTMVYAHRDIVHMLSGTVLGMFLGALDQTVVATALPAMVGELHGMEHLSWVVSAYLLSATAATPVYGKLSDIYGRSALFRIAIALFLLGSIACGLAQTMGELIAGRTLQGLGGGGLISLAMTIIADIVPPRERGRYQAYFTSVWSVATIGGPMLGGFLVDALSWRWVFWINLPIGAVALVICGAALKRLPRPGRTAPLDLAGVALLVPAIVALLLVTTWGGTVFPWSSPQVMGLAVAAAVFVLLLVVRELQAADPLLPPRLFRHNVVVVGNALAFLSGAASVGAVIFLPLFLQIVIGVTASNSGLLLLPFMIGITASATATGRTIRWTGRYKPFPIAGFAVAALSFLAFVWVRHGTPQLLYGSAMAMLGVGLGPMGPAVSIAVQNAVERRDMGTATSLNSFFRSMGGSFGVALLGAILLAGLTDQGGIDSGGLLHGGPAVIAALPAAVRQAVIAAFTKSFVTVYLVGAGICAFAFGLGFCIEELPLRTRIADKPEIDPERRET